MDSPPGPMEVDDPLAASTPDDNEEPVSGFSSAQCPVMPYLDSKEPKWICLDECAGNSEEYDEAEGAQESSDTETKYSEGEAMLKDELREGNQEQEANNGNAQYTEQDFVTMVELGNNHFELLPEGWIQITHRSGVPLYLHRPTRVCTFARPYYLGQCSARKHQVPLSAIPCLQYKQALEKEKLDKEKLDATTNVQLPLGTGKIETAEENKASQSIEACTIHKYCKSLFRFKTVQKMRLESSSDLRCDFKAKKVKRQLQIPQLPGDSKLITFPIQNPDDPDAEPTGEHILNPNGKSYACILQEYVQRAFRKLPTYELAAMKKPLLPFSATVSIDGTTYGSGTGTSKKQAKLSAAKAALEVLIPGMKEKFCDEKNQKRPASSVEEEQCSLSIFDEIKVEDPRVAELSAKANEPSPFVVLLTCLRRNYDYDSMPIDYKFNRSNQQPNEFIMSVGSHRVRVACKNKKDGKQMASQAILQELHPNIHSWGSLLRVYGNSSERNLESYKRRAQNISRRRKNETTTPPDFTLLEKLKSEMMKLNEERAKRKPIGDFIHPSVLPRPSSS